MCGPRKYPYAIWKVGNSEEGRGVLNGSNFFKGICEA